MEICLENLTKWKKEIAINGGYLILQVDIPDLLPIESDIYGGRCAGFYTTLYFFPGDY